MSSAAAKFSTDFELALKKETARSPFTEVKLFQAMMHAFASLKPQYYLEEFHGFKRQVYFDTTCPWMRSRARCELCDVLFVVYKNSNGLAARMSLLQAKLSRNAHATGLSSHVGKIEPQVFAGNYEQWDLLHRRPALSPTTVFFPPSNLLTSAVLQSVGTFGVFFRSHAGDIDLFYASADCVDVQVLPVGPDARLGKLRTVAGASTRVVSGKKETTYCSSARKFAEALFGLEIGTPIVDCPSGGSPKEYQPQLSWVREVIATHISESEGNAPTARDLLNKLGGADPLPKGAAVPSLIILRAEREPHASMRKPP